jgi:hypothetical protein
MLLHSIALYVVYKLFLVLTLLPTLQGSLAISSSLCSTSIFTSRFADPCNGSTMQIPSHLRS